MNSLVQEKLPLPQESDYGITCEFARENLRGLEAPLLREAEYYKYYSSRNPGNLPPIVITSNQICVTRTEYSYCYSSGNPGSLPPIVVTSNEICVTRSEYSNCYSSGNPGSLPPIVVTSNEISVTRAPHYRVCLRASNLFVICSVG
jgi:hypothetical protein